MLCHSRSLNWSWGKKITFLFFLKRKVFCSQMMIMMMGEAEVYFWVLFDLNKEGSKAKFDFKCVNLQSVSLISIEPWQNYQDDYFRTFFNMRNTFQLVPFITLHWLKPQTGITQLSLSKSLIHTVLAWRMKTWKWIWKWI